MWQFWRRHRRKVYVTLGVVGSGYLFYKLYEGHKRRISDLEKELADERRNEELIRYQVKVHFESIQTIADSTTLPHVMRYLNSRIEEELDLAHLTERLMKGKDQPNTLTAAEKLELWEKLKILTFTRIVLSLWATTMLSLFIRVQVNILGRHLYIDTARGLGSSIQFDEADLIDRDDEQKFLASADYLTNVGLPNLISCFGTATSEVLKAPDVDTSSGTTQNATEVRINHSRDATKEQKKAQQIKDICLEEGQHDIPFLSSKEADIISLGDMLCPYCHLQSEHPSSTKIFPIFNVMPIIRGHNVCDKVQCYGLRAVSIRQCL